MKAYKGSRGAAPSILASAKNGGEWSTSRPGRFTSGKESWIGGCVGPRAVLGFLEEIIIIIIIISDQYGCAGVTFNNVPHHFAKHAVSTRDKQITVGCAVFLEQFIFKQLVEQLHAFCGTFVNVFTKTCDFPVPNHFNPTYPVTPSSTDTSFNIILPFMARSCKGSVPFGLCDWSTVFMSHIASTRTYYMSMCLIRRSLIPVMYRCKVHITNFFRYAKLSIRKTGLLPALKAAWMAFSL
jgi:hypothetical protein